MAQAGLIAINQSCQAQLDSLSFDCAVTFTVAEFVVTDLSFVSDSNPVEIGKGNDRLADSALAAIITVRFLSSSTDNNH